MNFVGQRRTKDDCPGGEKRRDFAAVAEMFSRFAGRIEELIDGFRGYGSDGVSFSEKTQHSFHRFLGALFHYPMAGALQDDNGYIRCNQLHLLP